MKMEGILTVKMFSGMRVMAVMDMMVIKTKKTMRPLLLTTMIMVPLMNVMMLVTMLQPPECHAEHI